MDKKYSVIILFFIAILMIFIPNKIYATNRVINANEMSVFKKTKSQIQAKWNNSNLKLKDGYSIYEKEPSYTAPYSGGVVKQEYLNRVLANLNYYRYLIGSPEITKKMTNREDLQAGVVLQYVSLKSGNSLSHWLYRDFTKPDDMTEEFYNLGAYADHNIISSYSYGAPVFPFFAESYFTYTSGHRTALLSPSINSVEFGLGYTVYGDTNSDSFDYSKMSNDIAAYPSPGYFPKQDFTSASDWDIYLNRNKFSSLTDAERKNVVVTIKSLDNNKSYNYTVANNNLYVGYSTIHIKAPEKDTTYYEGDYEVTVKNLKDSSGNLIDLKYTVKFFDKYEGVKSTISSIRYGNLSSITIDGDYDEKVIKRILPKTASIKLESGSSTNVNIKDYKITKDPTYNLRYVGVATFNNIPSWAIDTNGYLKNGISIYLPYSDDNYKYNTTTYKTKSSENITLSTTYNGIYKEYINFVWVKRKDDSIEELKNGSKYQINGTSLTIKNLTPDDEADYYIIGKTKVPYLANGSPIYISKKLTVKLTDGLPEKVSKLKVSTQSQKTIKINWNKQSDITGYKIYVQNNSNKKYEYVGKSNKNSYKIKNLKVGTTYKIKVRAYKTINQKQYFGEYSDVLKATTKPLATKFTKIKSGKNEITLKWKKIAGVTGYKIYMSTNKTNNYKKIKTITNAKTIKFTKKGLKSGKKYYFKIRAYRTVSKNTVYSTYSSIFKSPKVK